MAIEYNPKEVGSTWPMGIYRAHIADAEEGHAKSSGKPMITMIFELHDRERGTTKIWERMVVPAALWKLQKIAQAIGKEAAFESGKFDPRDYKGANLEVEIDTEKQTGYSDKNVILEFLPIKPSSGAPAKDEKYEYSTSLPPEGGEEPPF